MIRKLENPYAAVSFQYIDPKILGRDPFVIHVQHKLINLWQRLWTHYCHLTLVISSCCVYWCVLAAGYVKYHIRHSEFGHSLSSCKNENVSVMIITLAQIVREPRGFIIQPAFNAFFSRSFSPFRWPPKEQRERENESEKERKKKRTKKFFILFFFNV